MLEFEPKDKIINAKNGEPHRQYALPSFDVPDAEEETEQIIVKTPPVYEGEELEDLFKLEPGEHYANK